MPLETFILFVNEKPILSLFLVFLPLYFCVLIIFVQWLVNTSGFQGHAHGEGPPGPDPPKNILILSINWKKKAFFLFYIGIFSINS